VELEAAARVAEALGAEEHRVIGVDLSAMGGSALTDDIAVPKDRPEAEIGEGVPITYVPARNSVFLSLALGWAEILRARDLFLGANVVDYSGYPDCRPAFLRAFEELARVATVAGAEGGAEFRVNAPLLQMTKAEIVTRGVELGVDFSLTHSCYDPAQTGEAVLACGRCDACTLRLAGFKEAGIEDPIPYARGDHDNG
jgi:7-cyano-7-deazaguanine synthase